jgi:hypothetical protein
MVDVPAVALPAETPLAAGPVMMPGRVAVRTDSPEVIPAARGHVSGTSVFDNLPPIEPIGSIGDGPAEPGEDDGGGGEPQRTSALRRLIGSLRRR